MTPEQAAILSLPDSADSSVQFFGAGVSYTAYFEPKINKWQMYSRWGDDVSTDFDRFTDFDTLEQLEVAMTKIAPLDQWSWD